MIRVSGKIRLIMAIGLALVISLTGGCIAVRDFNDHLSSIIKPYRFSIVKWELKTIFNRDNVDPGEKIEDEPSQVTEYFSLVDRISNLKSEIRAMNTDTKLDNSALLEVELNTLERQREELEDTAGRIITKQIKEVLAEQAGGQ